MSKKASQKKTSDYMKAKREIQDMMKLMTKERKNLSEKETKKLDNYTKEEFNKLFGKKKASAYFPKK